MRREMHRFRWSFPVLAGLLVYAAGGGVLFAGSWPQWRGPRGTSTSEETGLPLTWNQSEGLAWRCELPQWGTSTPAIWGDAIFVTAHRGGDLLLLKISKSSGRIEWTRRVGTGEAARKEILRKGPDDRRAQHFHKTHNLASPSPVTDGERVIAHFGNGDLASYTFAGRREWARNLQKDHGAYTIWWGHANSPVLHEDLVVSVCMQDSLADLGGELSPSYVVAHDKRTGEIKWKTSRMTGARAEANDSYTTPIFRRASGRLEMIVMGGTWIDAYDPSTGERLWCLKGLGGNRVIPGPALGNDMVYATVGMRGPVFAVKLGKKGALSQEDVVWRWTKGTPDSPSLVVWNDLLFMVSNRGIARCFDARTGRLHWEERLPGEYRASPLAAEERVYFLSMSGLTTVVAASSEFKKLSENRIPDQTIASPAVSDGRIYLRGRSALYCVGPAAAPRNEEPLWPPPPPPSLGTLPPQSRQTATPYAAWDHGPGRDRDYFPIAVWLQAPRNAARYKAAGINLYVGLWKGPTEAQLAALKQAGMPVICAQNEVGMKHRKEPTIVGWMHGDEPDNAQSLGKGKGYGPPVPPRKIIESYKRISAADPSRPVLLNLGQGVAWDGWRGRGVRTNHPEDYPEYVKGCDIASFDIYPTVHRDDAIRGNLWYVAHGVSRLRKWTGDRKVVWNCIECTRISNPNTRPTPHQVRAEVWMAIIHGSRGIIYFVHQFKPEFIEAGLLADSDMLEAVTAMNRQIRSLASVINSPTITDAATVRSSAPHVPVHVMVKRHGGATYLFAVSMYNRETDAVFTVDGLGAEATAEVLDEDRSIRIEKGRFADRFRGYDVHLYRIE